MKQVYYVKDFGSLAEAIHAMNRLTEERELIVSAGEYWLGPTTLSSNLTLTLEEGAVLKFKDNPYLYPPVWTRWEGVECFAMHPLLFAKDAQNLVIRGKGVIDGNGARWWSAFRKNLETLQAEPLEPYEKELARLNPGYQQQPSGGGKRETQFLRPPLVQFYNCQNLNLSGITLQNSPFWTLHTVYCQNVWIGDMKFYNPPDAINTDAIDLDSTENAVVKGCVFSVGDDAVTLKSGSGEDGLRVNRPTAQVSVEDCVIYSSHGGVTFGSETAGGIEDVNVENCQFYGTQRAIRIKTRRGRGGTIQNVRIKGIKCVENWCPIAINMYYQPGADPHDAAIFSTDPQPLDQTTPVVSGIVIQDVMAEKCRATGGFIVGLPESPVQKLVIQNYRYSLDAPEKLLGTETAEFTGGLFHDANRDLKFVNADDRQTKDIARV
jgi:polygalacturonase